MSSKSKLTIVLALVISLATVVSWGIRSVESGPAAIKHYVCSKAVDEIKIDGVLDEFSWESARRVGEFERILWQYPKIEFHTEAALLWDNDNLYIAFSCVDPDMWTTFTNRDDPLWSEEVVEVFIDPDGDGRNYLELEVNPLNVVVDLIIKQIEPKWESDIEWDIEGLRTAVRAVGTVNNPDDQDVGWTVEIAIPWSSFKDITPEMARPPRDGEQWRLNLYRIERVGGVKIKREIEDLRKQLDQAKKEEDYKEAARIQGEIQQLEMKTEYTCWSPTHTRGFHDPSRFGVVEFRGRNHGINTGLTRD